MPPGLSGQGLSLIIQGTFAKVNIMLVLIKIVYYLLIIAGV